MGLADRREHHVRVTALVAAGNTQDATPGSCPDKIFFVLARDIDGFD
jgi:hypothetical protein